ncbi:MAG: hypothetical protein V4525_07940 [Pseudomonadota bacterium]
MSLIAATLVTALKSLASQTLADSAKTAIQTSLNTVIELIDEKLGTDNIISIILNKLIENPTSEKLSSQLKANIHLEELNDVPEINSAANNLQHILTQYNQTHSNHHAAIYANATSKSGIAIGQMSGGNVKQHRKN